MNRTPLTDAHKAAGARLVDFAGWEMPVQFQGIIAEHKAVREKAGVFDISHMGQVWVTGPGALEYLQGLVTNDVSRAAPGKGLYALLCREDGGVVDDLFVYCLAPERYFLIVNASRASVDVRWMKDHLTAGAVLEAAAGAAAVALQGPAAESVLKGLCPEAARLPRNGVGEFAVAGGRFLVARTGYTGEDGFEVFAPFDGGHIVRFYSELLTAGAPHGLVPCGLGARDTLRLEMGYRLYGQDLDERHTALESGLGWVVKLDKPRFLGREALLREKAKGAPRRFVAFRLKERGVPRHGQAVTFRGKPAGEVASGTFSPSLGVGIGMGFVENAAFPPDAGAEGLAVRIHDRDVPVELAQPPFYRKPIPSAPRGPSPAAVEK
jgi:aminomethyltransferase